MTILWDEYDSATVWCAKRGIKGHQGDPLPQLLDPLVLDMINAEPEAFANRVALIAFNLEFKESRP